MLSIDFREKTMLRKINLMSHKYDFDQEDPYH